MQLPNLITTTSLALAGAAVALPAVGDKVTLPSRRDGGGGTAAATLELIMPKSASCDGRGDECTTAAVAAPLLVDSMQAYDVATGYEQAGILALIAYESVELQYRKNQNAEQLALGRGTANEQGGEFNVEYANTFPELAGLNLTTSNVLDYVTADKYNFATVSHSVFLSLSSLSFVSVVSGHMGSRSLADHVWARIGCVVLLLARQLHGCQGHGEERQHRLGM